MEENGVIRWNECTRDGLSHYHDVLYLGQTILAAEDSPFVQTMLSNDAAQEVVQRGFALQGTLRWGIEQLRVSNSSYARQNAEMLWLRYVEQKTVKACAAQLKRDEATIKHRQRKGWERLATVLQAEWEKPIASKERQRWMQHARYDACGVEEQRLLRFLAIFRRPVSPRIALTTDQIAFQPFLLRLLERGLVVQDAQMRVLVRDAMRGWVLQRLTSAEIRAFHTVAATYRAQQSQHASAIYHWQQAGAHTTAAQYLLDHTAQLGNDLDVLLSQFEQAHVSADLWARLKLLAGQRATQTKNLDIAFAAYEAALCADDPLLLATAHYQIGRLQRHRDIDTALAQYALCRQLLSDQVQHDGQQLMIQAVLGEAWVFIDQRPDLPKAETRLAKATKLLDQHIADPSVPLLEAAALQCDLANARAAYYVAADDLTTALDHRWEAWRFARQTQDVERAIKNAHNLAWDNLELAKYADAERMFLECQLLAQTVGDSMVDAACHKGLGACYTVWTHDYPRAIRHYLAAYTYFESVDSALWVALTCYDLAEIHILHGEAAAAFGYFNEGRTIAAQGEMGHLHASFDTLAETYVELSADFTPKQRVILNTIRTQGQIDKRTCITLLNIGDRTATRHLTKLQSQGVIQSFGRGRSVHYKFKLC